MIRKQSKQRDTIMNYMKNVQGHVSAEQIHEDLNRDLKTVSLATVYRNLNILVQMHEIKKIAHPVFGYVYDKTCIPHYHLHCIKCNKIHDIPFPYMLEFDAKLEEESQLTILSHDIMAEGLCENCRKK